MQWITPRNRKIALAAAGAWAIYFSVAIWLRLSYVPAAPPPGAVAQLRPPFDRYESSAFGFVVKVPELESISDSEEHPTRSNALIYENGKPLGPAHSQHADVANLGGGRFSHWRRMGFVFSTSDNTNPQTTGRRYWVVVPPEQPR